MLKYKYLIPFKQEEFSFQGAHCYFNDERCFLLSDIGTTIVLDSTLLDEIENRNISDNLSFKLYQRGFALAYDNPRFPDVPHEIKPTLFMISLLNATVIAFIAYVILRMLETVLQLSSSIKPLITLLPTATNTELKIFPFSHGVVSL